MAVKKGGEELSQTSSLKTPRNLGVMSVWKRLEDEMWSFDMRQPHAR